MKFFAAIFSILVSLATASFALAHDMESMQTEDSGSSGDNGAMGAMGGHKMLMSDHMTMTPSRAATDADNARGREIIAAAKSALAKYQDSDAAIADGYVPFMPTVPQDVYHFASRERTIDEYQGDFNLARPGSLLYEKKPLGGYRLVG